MEEEWCVQGVTGRVDYRTLHDRITVGQPRRFPGDPAAILTQFGTMLTADGWEAEVCTQPVAAGSATVSLIDASLVAGRSDLYQHLAPLLPGLSLEGWSTHINVSVDDGHATAVARRLRERCGPALGLLLAAGSAGVLVRPRRGRLEVCLDHVEARHLPRAVVAFTALVLMCSDRSRRAAWRELPVSDLTWTPSRERFGHHCRLEASVSERRSNRVWMAARDHVVRLGMVPDHVDEWLDGGACQRSPEPRQVGGRVLPEAPDLLPRRRPFGPAHARWLTWDVVAWECGDPGVMAVVPYDANRNFVAALDEGRLDHLIERRLARHRDSRRNGKGTTWAKKEQ